MLLLRWDWTRIRAAGRRFGTTIVSKCTPNHGSVGALGTLTMVSSAVIINAESTALAYAMYVMLKGLPLRPAVCSSGYDDQLGIGHIPIVTKHIRCDTLRILYIWG